MEDLGLDDEFDSVSNAKDQPSPRSQSDSEVPASAADTEKFFPERLIKTYTLSYSRAGTSVVRGHSRPQIPAQFIGGTPHSSIRMGPPKARHSMIVNGPARSSVRVAPKMTPPAVHVVERIIREPVPVPVYQPPPPPPPPQIITKYIQLPPEVRKFILPTIG